MLLPLRFPRLWLALGWILVAAAVWVCLTPNGIPLTRGMNDKWMHAAGYLVLTLWFAGIYPRSRYIVVGSLLLGMGVVVEILQGAMHLGRNADVNDVFANAVGIATGVILALTFLGGWMQRVESWIVPRG